MKAVHYNYSHVTPQQIRNFNIDNYHNMLKDAIERQQEARIRFLKKEIKRLGYGN